MKNTIWIAECHIFKVQYLGALEKLLRVLQSIPATRIQILIPEEVWSTSGGRNLAPLMSRFTSSFVTTPPAHGELTIRLEPTTALDKSCAALLSRLLQDTPQLHSAVLSLKDETQPFFAYLGSSKSPCLLHRVSCHSTSETVKTSMQTFENFELCRQQVLVVIGGNAKKAAQLIGTKLPFYDITTIQLDEKRPPSKQLIARLKQHNAKNGTILTATSQVGHAHTKGLSCSVCDQHSPIAMLRHVQSQLGLTSLNTLTR